MIMFARARGWENKFQNPAMQAMQWFRAARSAVALRHGCSAALLAHASVRATAARILSSTTGRTHTHTHALLHTSATNANDHRAPAQVPFPVGNSTLTVCVPSYVMDPDAFDAAVANGEYVVHRNSQPVISFFFFPRHSPYYSSTQRNFGTIHGGTSSGGSLARVGVRCRWLTLFIKTFPFPPLPPISYKIGDIVWPSSVAFAEFLGQPTFTADAELNELQFQGQRVLELVRVRVSCEDTPFPLEHAVALAGVDIERVSAYQPVYNACASVLTTSRLLHRDVGTL